MILLYHVLPFEGAALKLITDTIKTEFMVNCGVVHWDAKLMEDIAGHEKFERLPILISQREGV